MPCALLIAEDRVLTFELVSQRERHWVLRWVCNSVAETDVPQTLVELIKQRRCVLRLHCLLTRCTCTMRLPPEVLC